MKEEKTAKKKSSANKADKLPKNELIPLVEYGDLLTPNQVCEIYLISIHTLYKWVERKEIPYHRLGARKLVFHKKELSIWFSQSAECA